MCHPRDDLARAHITPQHSMTHETDIEDLPLCVSTPAIWMMDPDACRSDGSRMLCGDGGVSDARRKRSGPAGVRATIEQQCDACACWLETG
mmetsp:Transcript_28176/g.69516  ORF Transcript_28176/g.69516 Transcript_28176/m.69516 type:complete len:91 (+) Transcript_28176:252-524(+)